MKNRYSFYYYRKVFAKIRVGDFFKVFGVKEAKCVLEVVEGVRWYKKTILRRFLCKYTFGYMIINKQKRLETTVFR